MATQATHEEQKKDAHRRPEQRRHRRGLWGRLERLRPERLLPEPTYAHLRSAGREELLAVRSLVDALIDRLDLGEDDEP